MVVDALCLPRPTGPLPVGTTTLYVRDAARPDPWVAGSVARELMVSLWYPARSGDGPRARYLTPTESALLLRSGGVTGVPPDVLSRTRTHAVRDATPAECPGGLPLVVLSPGFTKPRATLTGLAEELASNGYAVVAIDHTYENVATTFPDGRVTTCLARETPVRGEAFWRRVKLGRAADVSFVLDELTGRYPAWLDGSRIAMVGHSAGGASSIAALLADTRVLAGVDIDGSTEPLIPATGLARPFLFLGRRSQYLPGTGDAARTWERDWPLLTGWRRWLVVAGARHASFTDIGLLGDQLGLASGTELPGIRVTEITRACVLAFVDLHLRGEPSALLDDPTAHYPEVTRC